VLGAFAVDALDPMQAREVRAHLRDCATHAAEASELRAVTAGLADTVEPLTPPASLRSRVIAAVAVADQRGTPGTGAARRVRWRGQAWTWAAAAAAVAIVGLVAWNVVLLTRSSGESLEGLARRAQIVSTLQPQGAPGGGVVLYFPDDRKAIVLGNGIRELDAAVSTYQLWEIAGDTPRSIGVMQADPDGRAVAVVPFEGGAGHTLAITVEPPGGSVQPTTAPVFVTKI